jgi:glycosyltransferase involved in cell wall biosynthesis
MDEDHKALSEYEEAEALLRNGHRIEAATLIDTAYKANPFLVDGYSRLANVCRHLKHWTTARRFFQLDVEAGRISNNARLRYAETLLVTGDEQTAHQIIEAVYSADPRAQDGYARIGWAKGRIGSWESAVALMARDYNEHRISPMWMLHYAEGLLIKRAEEKAERIVHEAYQLDRSLLDGYACLANIKRSRLDWHGAKRFFLQDLALNRLSPESTLRYAEVLLELGDDRESFKLVDAVYQKVPDVKDGHARLGWVRARSLHWHDCIELMESDYSLGRMTPEWKLHFAYAAMQTDDTPNAYRLLEEAYSDDRMLQDGGWRIGYYKYRTCAFRSAASFMIFDDEKNRLSTKATTSYLDVLERSGDTERARTVRKRAYDWLKSIDIANVEFDSLRPLAELALKVGKFDLARSLARRAYSQSETEKDLFTKLGWDLFCEGNAQMACEMMAEDHEEQRMSERWKPEFHRVLSTLDRTNEFSMDLPDQQQIMATWNKEKPLVSIVCISFNHAEFIDDTMRGFLIQESSYPFEIIVHDDASQDGTQDILSRYQSRYPKLIKLILQKTNQHSQGIRVYRYYRELVNGVYTALCEGDDYWVRPDKLEKQVSFLEANPDFFLSAHGHITHNQTDGSKDETCIFHGDVCIDREALLKSRLHGKNFVLRTQTIVTRSYYFLDSELMERSQVMGGDYFVTSTYGLLGKCMYFGDYYGAVFRQNCGSAWTSLDERRKNIERVTNFYWMSMFYRRIKRSDIADYWGDMATKRLGDSLAQTKPPYAAWPRAT